LGICGPTSDEKDGSKIQGRFKHSKRIGRFPAHCILTSTQTKRINENKRLLEKRKKNNGRRRKKRKRDPRSLYST